MAVELLEHGAVLKTYPMGPCSAIISEAAHVCTQREGDPAKDKAFVKQLMKMRHWSPFEFVALSWDTITNRAVANEIVRHRLASYMQESQRYIRYNNLPVVMPVGVKKKGALARGVWKFGQWVSFCLLPPLAQTWGCCRGRPHKPHNRYGNTHVHCHESAAIPTLSEPAHRQARMERNAYPGKPHGRSFCEAVP